MMITEPSEPASVLIYWENGDGSGYKTVMLGEHGDTLAKAMPVAGEQSRVHWFESWTPASPDDNPLDSQPITEVSHPNFGVRQSRDITPGILVVWAEIDGVISNELVLIILGEGGSNGAGGSAYTTTTGDIKSDNDSAADQPPINTIEYNALADLALLGSGKPTILWAPRIKAALELQAKQVSPAPAPSDLNALMKIISNPIHPEQVLDQYLWVWVNGSPSVIKLSLKIDDGAEFQPAWTWNNPGTTQPAIIKIDGAEIPGDGLTHRITVAVWQEGGGNVSQRATTTLYATTPSQRTGISPEWCGVELLRQSTPELGDLSLVRWRHVGAVRIIVSIPVFDGSKTVSKTVTVGYADYDESEFLVENIGVMLQHQLSVFAPVLFGVAAIRSSGSGQILFASHAVHIKTRWPATPAPTLPDADTARGASDYALSIELYGQMAAAMGGSAPANLQTIIHTTMSKMRIKIKDVVRKGGSVTLQDFGQFRAQWNSAMTVRQPRFTASRGFIAGTRNGTVMTDAEATE